MTIEQVYKYGGYNWSHAMRLLNLGNNTYQSWQRLNYIPMATQRRIELNSNGDLKADSK